MINSNEILRDYLIRSFELNFISEQDIKTILPKSYQKDPIIKFLKNQFNEQINDKFEVIQNNINLEFLNELNKNNLLLDNYSNQNFNKLNLHQSVHLLTKQNYLLNDEINRLNQLLDQFNKALN